MRVAYALALGAACALTSAATAAEIAPGDVKIVEGVLDTPLTEKAGDPEAGRVIFANRKLGNCLACHMVTELLDSEQFHGEVGPPLDGVADVYTVGELRARIVNPKTELPDTIMPSFYRVGGTNRTAEKFAGKTILSAQQVEDVLAYLQTLKE
jgi:sulfur-oxidizing protein SoxX